MKYKITPANNLRSLLPQLPKECYVESDTPLTIGEIAVQLGIPSLLVVAGLIEKTLYPLDKIVENEAEIVLLGPVAGG